MKNTLYCRGDGETKSSLFEAKRSKKDNKLADWFRMEGEQPNDQVVVGLGRWRAVGFWSNPGSFFGMELES